MEKGRAWIGRKCSVGRNEEQRKRAVRSAEENLLEKGCGVSDGVSDAKRKLEHVRDRHSKKATFLLRTVKEDDELMMLRDPWLQNRIVGFNTQGDSEESLEEDKKPRSTVFANMNDDQRLMKKKGGRYLV
ncbi:unnamed protein product [Sphenostylis stenocarpa]|uniref:Uncharacterized protein n=1 Tax=Sphenostylis stenocarpa TaxID=92480 RepID=A0AA86RTT6_9FABA|nr:unnamed protein product [Sphenostylis stenocarpa]